MQTYAIARLDDIDPLPDGRYHYRPVRHHLGIQGFGATAWVGAAPGDPIINEYDEDSEPAEELFATSGTLVFTAQGTRRTAVAAEPATTILVIDGTPGKAYDASGWELWAPLRPLYDKGEHVELSARLEDLIAANPQYPMLVYNLACSESLSGRTADAIDHLRRAVGASEKLCADARKDSDFDPIRDEPTFKALIGEPAEPRSV